MCVMSLKSFYFWQNIQTFIPAFEIVSCTEVKINTPLKNMNRRRSLLCHPVHPHHSMQVLCSRTAILYKHIRIFWWKFHLWIHKELKLTIANVSMENAWSVWSFGFNHSEFQWWLRKSHSDKRLSKSIKFKSTNLAKYLCDWSNIIHKQFSMCVPAEPQNFVVACVVEFSIYCSIKFHSVYAKRSIELQSNSFVCFL